MYQDDIVCKDEVNSPVVNSVSNSNDRKKNINCFNVNVYRIKMKQRLVFE